MNTKCVVCIWFIKWQLTEDFLDNETVDLDPSCLLVVKLVIPCHNVLCGQIIFI